MLHVDIPTRAEIEALVQHREAGCVSIYLPTTPITAEAQADRITYRNLAKEAMGQLNELGLPKPVLDTLDEQCHALGDDDEFWAHLARSLAVFVTPERIRTFRLANHLQPSAQVADRFHVKPLLRAVTASQHAFILVMTQDTGRLVEVTGDLPAHTVKVPDMPKDMSHAVGRGSLHSRSPRGRIQGSEGRKVRMDQYARAVDRAVRGFLRGQDTPLILAASSPLDSIFRSVCTYPHLAGQTIEGNPEALTDAELAERSRAILDALHAERIAAFKELFETRTTQRRTSSDIDHTARAATMGAVATIAVDIDDVTPGSVDDTTGTVTLAEGVSAQTHGVVDEIAGRVLMHGGEILALRRDDIPGGGRLAAIFRYPSE